jgi:hypothetical protein
MKTWHVAPAVDMDTDSDISEVTYGKVQQPPLSGARYKSRLQRTELRSNIINYLATSKDSMPGGPV